MAYRASGCLAPGILDLCIKWRWVVTRWWREKFPAPAASPSISPNLKGTKVHRNYATDLAGLDLLLSWNEETERVHVFH